MASRISTRLPGLRGERLCTITRSPAFRPARIWTLPSRSDRPRSTGTKRGSSFPSSRQTPSWPSRRCRAALGTQGMGGWGVRSTVTSASSPRRGRGSGSGVKPTLASNSSVTASARGSTRSTTPARVARGWERRLIRAGSPAARPPAPSWSKRVSTQSCPASITSTTDWPATRVLPGSASRATTRASTGATRRRLARWRTRASCSASIRFNSCSADSRLARAAWSPASATCAS